MVVGPLGSRSFPSGMHVRWTTVGVWAVAIASWTILLLQRAPLEFVLSGLFVLVLAKVSLADLRERRIPNQYTVWGFIAAVSVAALRGTDTALLSFAGAAMALGIMGLAYLVSGGRLGMGDVKLSVFIGAVLGVDSMPVFLMLSSFLGCGVGLFVFLQLRDRRATFAYGPCLAAAAAVLIVARGSVG